MFQLNDHLDDVEKEFAPLHKPTLEQFENTQKTNYLITVFIYIGYMVLPILLSLLVIIMFQNNNNFFVEADPTTNAIELALSDVNSVLIVDRSRFEEGDPIYEKFFYNVYKNGYYSVYTHKSATFYATDAVFTPNTTDPNNLDYNITLDGLHRILNAEKTTWSNNAQIKFYIPIDDVPLFVQNTPIDIAENKVQANILPTDALNNLFSFAIYVIVMIPMVLILKPVLSYDYMHIKSNQKSDIISKVGIGVLYIFSANIAINIAVTLLNSLLKIPDQISANQLSINRALASPYFILMAFMAVIMAPIVEELVFRKSLFGLIKSQKIALIVSALIFGSIHITTEIFAGDLLLALTNGLTYIGGGLVLGLIYIQNNKNIWINILVHMVYNLIGILMVLLLP